MRNKKRSFYNNGYNHWSTCFLSVRPLYRYLLTITIITGVIATWHTTIDQFLTQSIITCQQENAALVAHCLAISSAIAEVKQLDKISQELCLECETYENDQFNRIHTSGVCLLPIATKTGLHIEEYSQEEKVKNVAQKDHLHYRLLGKYDQLINFFDILIAEYPFLKIKTNTIERHNNDAFSLSLHLISPASKNVTHK